MMLSPWLTGLPFVTLFPAVIAVTFLCGSMVGLAATLAAILSAWIFIVPSGGSAVGLYRTMAFGVGGLTIVALVGVMRSATAHVRHLNETLRVSEGKFRGLMETAPDAMVIVDERRRIVLINAETLTLLGYRRGDLIGQPIEMLLQEHSRAPFLAQLTALANNPWAVTTRGAIALTGRRRDGSEFPIEVRIGPLKTETGILISSTLRDVTERRQIEASLARASQAKSDFLASMSHELRTPLNAIIGFSEMIRDAAIGPLDARYRSYASDIHESGSHLRDIINDILDIAKIEGGRLELRDEIVSIAEAAEACRRMVAIMAETAGVVLSVDVCRTLPPIRSDELRFRQILLNLMSNAVKFTPAGGRVSVSATIDAEGAVIVVDDTGIGMKPEDIAIALEPFRQIDGALSRRYNGTGLGLPLAKALVELHGGALDICSVPNLGTQVRIRLPQARLTTEAA